MAAFARKVCAQHVQILCITHQTQVAAQSDQHLLVKKCRTDPASSTIVELEEDARNFRTGNAWQAVLKLMTLPLQHAKQLRPIEVSTGLKNKSPDFQGDLFRSKRSLIIIYHFTGWSLKNHGVIS